MRKSLPSRGREKGMSGSESSVGKGLETGSGGQKEVWCGQSTGCLVDMRQGEVAEDEAVKGPGLSG